MATTTAPRGWHFHDTVSVIGALLVVIGVVLSPLFDVGDRAELLVAGTALHEFLLDHMVDVSVWLIAQGALVLWLNQFIPRRAD